MTLRVGMDVEVWRKPGQWMIVGFEGRLVRCVSIDAPGDVWKGLAENLRPIWREGVNCAPADHLASEVVP